MRKPSKLLTRSQATLNQSAPAAASEPPEVVDQDMRQLGDAAKCVILFSALQPRAWRSLDLYGPVSSFLPRSLRPKFLFQIVLMLCLTYLT